MIFVKSRLIGLILVSVGCMFLLGCGESEPPAVDVQGKVTFKGKPLSNAAIWFTSPKTGAGFSGNLNQDGAYTVKLLQVRPGDTFQVSFANREPVEGEPTKLDGAGVPVLEMPDLPGKYFDPAQSGLTANVESLEPQTFDFTLESK